MKCLEENRIRCYLLVLFQLFLLILSGIIFYFDVDTIFLRNMLILIFVECGIISFYGGKFNFFQVFLATSMFFIISRPFLEFFWEMPAGLMTYASIQVKIPKQYLIIAYQVYIVALLSTSIGWLIGGSLFKNEKKINPKHSIVAQSVNFLFVIIALLYLFKLIIMINYFRTLGYGWRTTDGLTYPWFLRGTGILFTVFSICALFFSQNKKDYLKRACLCIIVYLFLLLTGVRGEPLYTVIVILTVWTYFYQKLSIKTLFFLGGFLLAGVYGIGLLRTGTKSLGIDTFLWQQGVSFCVLPLSIMYKSQIQAGYPLAFGYILDFFKSSPVPGVIEGEHRLTQLLMYQLSPEYYAMGNNIGTSQSAELYDLAKGNLFIIGIMYFFLMLLAMYLLKHLYDNLLTFYWGFIYLCLFVYSPRYSVFYIVRNVYVYGFAIVLVLWAIYKQMKTYLKIKKITL